MPSPGLIEHKEFKESVKKLQIADEVDKLVQTVEGDVPPPVLLAFLDARCDPDAPERSSYAMSATWSQQ